MQHLAQCNNNCDVTVATLPTTITSTLDCMGQSPIQTVPACPVQIRAHHHIDVYTDINKIVKIPCGGYLEEILKFVC